MRGDAPPWREKVVPCPHASPSSTTIRGSARSYCAVLADAGYEPAAFVAGIGVHEALRALAPAAIILDVPHDLSTSALHWPAVAVLAQEAVLRHTPLLACVSDGDDDALRRIAALGLPFTVLLSKPVALDDLLARLRCLVGDGSMPS